MDFMEHMEQVEGAGFLSENSADIDMSPLNAL